MAVRDNYSNDNEIVAGMIAGDETAFRILVEKFREKVIATSMGFVHSETDSDDIAQEVFIEVFRSINKFRGDSSLSTWIYRITVNKALNYIRKANRRKLLSWLEDEKTGDKNIIEEQVSGKESCPDSEITKSEQAVALEKAMNKLVPQQRTAFILSKYDNLSYEEIAEVLNTTVPAVESLIFRAKRNLQKSLYNFYKNNFE